LNAAAHLDSANAPSDENEAEAQKAFEKVISSIPDAEPTRTWPRCARGRQRPDRRAPRGNSARDRPEGPRKRVVLLAAAHQAMGENDKAWRGVERHRRRARQPAGLPHPVAASSWLRINLRCGREELPQGHGHDPGMIEARIGLAKVFRVRGENEAARANLMSVLTRKRTIRRRTVLLAELVRLARKPQPAINLTPGSPNAGRNCNLPAARLAELLIANNDRVDAG